MKGNPKICSEDFCMDNECWRIYEKNIQALLQRGLSDRAKLVRVVWRSTPLDWNVEDVCTMQIGVLILFHFYHYFFLKLIVLVCRDCHILVMSQSLSEY